MAGSYSRWPKKESKTGRPHRGSLETQDETRLPHHPLFVRQALTLHTPVPRIAKVGDGVDEVLLGTLPASEECAQPDLWIPHECCAPCGKQRGAPHRCACLILAEYSTPLIEGWPLRTPYRRYRLDKSTRSQFCPDRLWHAATRQHCGADSTANGIEPARNTSSYYVKLQCFVALRIQTS
jgi:hypothetical protein